MPKPSQSSEVPSDFGQPCDGSRDLAAPVAGLEAFEIIQASPANGFQALAVPTIAQAWIARIDHPDPSRAEQSRACRQLIKKLVSTSEMIDGGLRSTNDCRVVVAPSGAPGLSIGGEPSGFQVSVSHSRNWLGVAITHQPRIGLDVEASKPRGRFRDMAEYLAWGGEIASFDDFLARWTLWEACVKLGSSSIFSSFNPAFEALCPLPEDRLFFSSGSWACVRSRLSEKAHFALVVELESPRPLVLRHYRSKSLRLDVANPATQEFRAP